MNSQPLVSVICLCYNHAPYVESAVHSVLAQDYGKLELIVVDDASQDDSAGIIGRLASELDFRTIFHTDNQGNCPSFNEAFKLSKGQYIIDLAADDILVENRISTGVEMLERLGLPYGVHFSDVLLLDEKGHPIRTHYRRDERGNLLEAVPQGDVYRDVLERYFISTPSMLIRRKVLEQLGGYDESLSYEDFDFWVRSARDFKYSFSDEVLVKKRILGNSLSKAQLNRRNNHALSTAIVCEKALQLNRNKAENQSLVRRIKYELKWALITENTEASRRLIELLQKLGRGGGCRFFARLLIMLRIPVYWFFKIFYRGK